METTSSGSIGTPNSSHSRADRLALSLTYRRFVPALAPLQSVAVYLTKLRYDARASILSGDRLPAMWGIGGPAAA